MHKCVSTDNICGGNSCTSGSCQTRSGAFVYISVISDYIVTGNVVGSEYFCMVAVAS